VAKLVYYSVAKNTPSQSPTILLVDDEWDLLVLFSKMLEKVGYEVHAFSNPVKALEHIRDEGCQKCNFVLSDIRMPGKSGFELVRQLKELRPEMEVVLMTAFKINKGEAQLVLPSTKVDAFIRKPFDIKELQEAIKEIGRKQQQNSI
jgi:CheY-like chemotaxis protein